MGVQDVKAVIFLSTLPVRGATGRFGETMDAAEFLSTLPVRGATYGLHYQKRSIFISIHAPREGSDLRPMAKTALYSHFYPRSP